MGGLFSAKAPAPLPTPAKPVTAVAKTPDLELAEPTLESEKLRKRKRGKRALRTDITQEATQTGAEGTTAGLQIQKD